MLTDPPAILHLFVIGGEIMVINLNIITNINNRMKRRKAAARHLMIDSVVQIGHLMIVNNIIIISITNITDNTNNTNIITIIIAGPKHSVKTSGD